MRGQAFVIFKDINSAMEIKRRYNGKELYNKTMVSLAITDLENQICQRKVRYHCQIGGHFPNEIKE